MSIENKINECPYCKMLSRDFDDFLNGYSDPFMGKEINESKFYLSNRADIYSLNYKSSKCFHSIEINYCPMCGRKLRF